MEYIKIIGVWVLFFFTALYYTGGEKPGGSVLVELHYLKTPVTCPCDYQLTIWITCDGNRDSSACLYGVGKTGIFYNKSSISFAQDLGNGSRNPLAYNFTSFQGNLGISILATNPTTRSKIDDYRFHKPIYPGSYGKKKWSNETLRANGGSNSLLKLSYQVFCKQHYYGPSCLVGCIPGDNYKCDESSGKKLCLNGYIGPNCTCKPGHKYTCLGTGKRSCYPPWHGVNCDVKCQERNDRQSGYTCDKITGSKICRRGWYGPECNESTRVKISSSYSSRHTHSSTILRNNSRETLTTTNIKTQSSLKKSSNYHIISSSPRKTISTIINNTLTLMTSSFLTSSSPTSFMTLPFVIHNETASWPRASIVTQSPTTSLFKTPSTINSQLLPSYTLSTFIESGIHREKSTSMTIRDFTVQTEHGHPQITTINTSYPVDSTRVGVAEKTETLTVSSMDTSQVIIDQAETIRERRKSVVSNYHKTESIHGSIENSVDKASVPEFFEPTVSRKLDPRDRTRKQGTETRDTVLSGTTQKAERRTSRPTCCDVTITSTPHGTTFRAGSPDTSKDKDIWWLVLVPVILAILLIVAGVTIYKKKNRKGQVTPLHYEAPMHELDEMSNEKIIMVSNDAQNTQKESGEEDLEAIWRQVRSTSHQ